MSIPTRTASNTTDTTSPIWSPDTLTSSPGAAAVFEFNANDSADFKTNASGAVTEVLNSLNTSQYLLAEGTPIKLASGEGAGGKDTLLQFVPTYQSPNTFDSTTNWLSAGGLKGPDSSLVNLANSTNLSTNGSFTAIIAMDILGATSTKPAPYEAGPLWGAPQVPGPFQYIQLRENPGSGKQGANLADSVSNTKGTGAVNPQGGVTTGWHVLTMIKGDGALTYRLDGKTVATAAITATDAFTSTDFMIGGGFAPNASGENGVPAPYVGEFQAYSGMLSATDLGNAEALAASSIGVTLPTTPTIALSAPGTVQEASVGAGVTVNETITTTNLTGTVYAEVLTSSGSIETAFQAITLATSGVTTQQVHLAKTGDVIKVVNNTTSPTVSQTSAAVTITDPVPSIALSAPGTVQEASVGAGVTVTETITTKNLTGTVYAEVLTSSGSIETAFQPITLATGGVTTQQVHLAKTGDVIKVVNNTTSPTVSQTSAAVTITDPVPSIALSAPGTVQEASVGAGVTVTETITTKNLTGTVYAEVLTSSGSVETAFQPITLATSGVTTQQVHLAKTGDVIKVVDNTTSPTVSQTSAAVTITDPSTQTLTAVLPSPLYTGTETVTGTGAVAGLRLERITQGTYNTPGQSGWVNATVAANGNWSAQLTFTKPGMLAHVYAQNGGTGAVVDLIDGTPVQAPTVAAAARTALASAAADMTATTRSAAAVMVQTRDSHGGVASAAATHHTMAVIVPDHIKAPLHIG